MTHRTLIKLLILPSLLVACSSAGGDHVPRLGVIYNREAQADQAHRNPVIMIPGILGSRLVDPSTGRSVWGTFGGDAADPETPEGSALVALPFFSSKSLVELRDEVRPDGVLGSIEVDILGFPILVAAYLNVLRTLGVGEYRDESSDPLGDVDYGKEHFTSFQFAYDWRLDNVSNARRLHEFILEKKAYVEAERERRYGEGALPVKFDLVAHSMGGLIARYYLRYGTADLPGDGSTPEVTWAGAEHVERTVLVATPSAGSVHSLLDLVHGRHIATFLPDYSAPVLGTFPSMYQLLPRPRHKAVVDSKGAAVDILDPKVWEHYGWGLTAPEVDESLAELNLNQSSRTLRRQAARSYLSRCLDRARAFHVALDQPARLPDDLRLYLFAGDAVDTDLRLAVDESSGDLEVVERTPGDGTVPRTSALMDERVGGEWSPRIRTPIHWSQVIFVFEDHVGLTKDPEFVDNLLYLLLEAPEH